MSTFGKMIAAIAGVLLLSSCSSVFIDEPPAILIPHAVSGNGSDSALWLNEDAVMCQDGYDVVTLTPDNPSHDIESRSSLYGPRYSVFMEGGSDGDINFTFVEGLPTGVIVEYAVDGSKKQRIAYSVSYRSPQSRIIAESGNAAAYSNLTQVDICY